MTRVLRFPRLFGLLLFLDDDGGASGGTPKLQGSVRHSLLALASRAWKHSGRLPDIDVHSTSTRGETYSCISIKQRELSSYASSPACRRTKLVCVNRFGPLSSPARLLLNVAYHHTRLASFPTDAPDLCPCYRQTCG